MAQTTTSAPKQQVNMPAVDLRQLVGELIAAEGVRVSTDLAVSQRGAGANMSVDVAAGACVIQDDHGSGGGFYGYTLAATQNVSIAAADASNPRIDRIVIRVRDAYLGDAANDIGPYVVAGTPSSGATLANLTGAAAVPASCLLIANVLVPAGATSIVTADIDTNGASSSAPTTVRPQMAVVNDEKGADIASASAITPVAQLHKITGTATINTIRPFAAGKKLILWFAAAATVSHNNGGSGGTGAVEFADASNHTMRANDVLILISDGTNWYPVISSSSALVATTVAGLGTGSDGKVGRLRLGSTPYDFVDLVYDATYGKWVSADIRILNSTFSQSGTTATTDFQAAFAYIQHKVNSDAGLALQVRYLGYLNCTGVGNTAGIDVRGTPFNDGDTSGAGATTVTLLAKGNYTTGTWKDTGWLTGPAPTAKTMEELELLLTSAGGGATNVALQGALIGRWVG